MASQSIEQYALEHGRLHPKAIQFLAPYFDIDLERVKVNAKLGKTSALGTSVWVLADVIMVQRGKFNQEFEQWVERTDEDGTIWHNSNRAIDLSTVHGMLTLAHECYHVQQWLTRPWWSSLTTWIADLFRSLWYERRIWSHTQSQWERQAIDFQHRIAPDITRRQSDLEIFKSMR